jgi:hypothetical protein
MTFFSPHSLLDRFVSALSGPCGRALLVLAGLLLGVGCFSAPAGAQDWRQHVTVQTTVPNDGPLRTFLDSLARDLTAADSLRVRRKPGTEKVSVETLRDRLLTEGLGIISTNRVAIEYSFSLRRDRLVERIHSLQFTCDLPGPDGRLKPILHVSGDHPVVDAVLRGSIPRTPRARLLTGDASPVAEPAPPSLPEALEFPTLIDAEGRPLQASRAAGPARGADLEATAFARRLRTFVYERGSRYVTQPH